MRGREGIAPTGPRNLIVFLGLKDLGVLPPIDDFSASNASHRFASLKRLQADYPKIGRYFVGAMLTGQKTLALISSMLGGRRLIDCMSEPIRCAVLAPTPILLVCPGCCVPCAYRFISLAGLISVSLGKL